MRPGEERVGESGFEPQSGITVIDRAVAVMDAFTHGQRRLGVSEVARLTGLSTSTAHRVLASLITHGMVVKVGQRYTLGPRILKLAAAAHDTANLTLAARPVMTWLRDATGETVGLHVVRDGGRFVIDQVESTQPLRRIYTEWGQAIPLHEGSPGKVLLAHLPERERAAMLSAPLERVTDKTIVDPVELAAELERIRADGYAFSLEERVVGIRTMAAPIRDYSGHVISALSVSGPAIRVTEEWMHGMLPALKKAGAEISEALGYSGG